MMMPYRQNTVPEDNLWQLLPFLDAPGDVQMAIDRWMLDQFQRGHIAPSLRFYAWSGPTISLGYHQRQWPHAWSNLIWQGGSIDIVRRPTGGRAVLHQGDLTYALVMKAPRGYRKTVYRQVCEFLRIGLAQLQMPVAFGGDDEPYQRTHNCFGAVTSADLVDAKTGWKRVGSAQLWRQGCLLQHGSIPLLPDATLFEQVFGEPPLLAWLPPELTKLSQHDLQEQLVAALTNAAADCFRAKFQRSSLQTSDINEALALWGETVRITHAENQPRFAITISRQQINPTADG